ncbi:MAG: glycine--tRNA ligase subunit beta [Halieaceae bacterium]|jgi:glycyl-tRNA synthetase beta chain|nr:glycine--tRNA ligase subunit beta [Halieaceae bacterium]
MSTQDLLFELGTEELPAGPLAEMAIALHDDLCAGLDQSGLTYSGSRWFATPRRLAVLVEGLALSAPDIEREILGPPAAAAKDDSGAWTPAAAGFARKQGLDPDTLEVIDTPKGPRVGVRRVDPGAQASEAVPMLVADAVRAIPVAKRMRWGRSRDEFLRPVQWLVLMLGADVLPLELFGLQSSSTSRGHRFHHPDPVVISEAGDYVEAMRGANVLADYAERRALIRSQVEALAVDGAQAVIDEDLLDEVTGLVEWPVALKGSFDPAFLEVPAAALISSMKEHQKYFHLVDPSGALRPEFITVSNIESSDPKQVIAGNERVIRPRLSDAAFFFETDKQTPLADRGERLAGVLFQQKLGTLADKRNRMMALTRQLAEHLGANAEVASRAATLAKCDLVSEMVLEFPELQGIAGSHYARHDGEPEGVARAIEQHYWPRFAGDHLPESAEAAAVALADRLDTLVGIFGIGQTPTGSKDPFGLRRAALAVVRILLDQQAGMTLHALAEAAVDQYAPDLLHPDTVDTVVTYVIERLPAWYSDQDISVDVLRAVTATGISDPSDIDARVKALQQFAQSDASAALAAANKRVANILAKSDATFSGEPDKALFEADAEKQLASELESVEATLVPLLADRDYAGALSTLATLRDPVDAFFDSVMVNADDPALRDNRLRLLASLRDKFVRVADIAQLAAS